MNYNNNQVLQQNNYPYGVQPGMNYAQRPVPKMTQLTPEEIKQLRGNGGTFNLQFTDIDFLKAKCTHRENGQIVLVQEGDYVRCPICGAKFKVVSTDIEDVQNVINVTLDVLQSIKTLYLDIPEGLLSQAFNMIPVLEKMPQLYSIALASFNKYEGGQQFQQNGNMYGIQALQLLTGSPMMGMPMQQPYPMYPQQQVQYNMPPQGYAPQQQVMYQQPQFVPQQQASVMPGANPLGYYSAPVQQQPPMQQAPAPQNVQQQDKNQIDSKSFTV